MIKKIHDIEYVFLLCQRFQQPIGDLYSTVIPWQILKRIAFTNPRILMGIDENGKEEYSGIQRALSEERQKEISNYINQDLSATFPSSIIINITKDKLDVIEVNPQISIDNINLPPNKEIVNVGIDWKQEILFPEKYLFVFPYEENVAQIIDGQHRMSGFQNSSDELKFDLPITIFVEQTIDKQAEIFSTINGKQTRVSPSLVYDLFGLSSKRSPYKVANEIVKLLNESDYSPLKNWIRILGKANDFYAGYITQSTVVKSLILLYCGNIKQAEEDKRILANGKKPTQTATLSSRATIFRDFYINEEDDIIFKSIINFFNAVKETFPAEWENPNSIFKTTIGFESLFRLFMRLAEVGIDENDLSKDHFLKKLLPSKNISFDDILLSSKGINQLYERFVL